MELGEEADGTWKFDISTEVGGRKPKGFLSTGLLTNSVDYAGIIRPILQIKKLRVIRG